MAHLTDAEMEAREEGKDAFEEGKPRSANPYSPLSQKNLVTCWEDGWDEAKTESEEDGEDDA